MALPSELGLESNRRRRQVTVPDVGDLRAIGPPDDLVPQWAPPEPGAARLTADATAGLVEVADVRRECFVLQASGEQVDVLQTMSHVAEQTVELQSAKSAADYHYGVKLRAPLEDSRQVTGTKIKVSGRSCSWDCFQPGERRTEQRVGHTRLGGGEHEEVYRHVKVTRSDAT